MNRSPLFLITTFGLGRMRPASGTWGSLPPVLLAAALIAAGVTPVDRPVAYHLSIVAVLVIFAWACVMDGDAAEARFGRKDPGEVVADETSGQCIPLLALPIGAGTPGLHWAGVLAGAFVAFRILDIIKPPPAYGLQRVGGGWGILLDDLIAGVYAAVVVQLVARLVFSM
ncbi:MAG: phosphatidylglycerophosphatase A [Phycisphaeraceae bacterium]|nr:MAG: phosphatidylglycerophosphatase A [Phycisphaeraceae bacterium]